MMYFEKTDVLKSRYHMGAELMKRCTPEVKSIKRYTLGKRLIKNIWAGS